MCYNYIIISQYFIALVEQMEADPNQESAEQNKEKERPSVVAAQTPIGQKLEAEKPKANTQESAKPKRPYFWTPIFRWIKRDSTATDWIIAIFTIVIASVGYFQYTEMDDSGRQTDKMLHFVRSQLKEQHIAAASAQAAASAASTQATNTETLAKRALAQAKATNRMATEAKRAADIAQSGLDAQERPWIGYDHLDTPDNVAVESLVNIGLVYRNWGKGPSGLYLYARILYTDRTGSVHWRHFCGKWKVGTDKTFEGCSAYNDGDEDYPGGKEP